jgi:hypothetical protein
MARQAAVAHARSSVRTSLILAVALAASIPDARADAPQSHDPVALFRQGRDAMKVGDYRSACASFEESQRLDPAAGTLLNLAICSERLGRLLRARTALGQFLDQIDAADERRPHAEALLADVEERTPRLRLQVPDPTPTGVSVRLDGEGVPRDRWQAPISVDPGEHVLELKVPQGPAQRRSFVIKERESYTQGFTFASAQGNQTATPPRSAPAPRSEGRRQLPASFYVSLGIGIGGFVTAAASGLYVLKQRATVAEHCENKRCDAEGLAAADQGKRFEVINTVALPIGAVGTALAGYLWFKAKPEANGSTMDVTVSSSHALMSARGNF